MYHEGTLYGTEKHRSSIQYFFLDFFVVQSSLRIEVTTVSISIPRISYEKHVGKASDTSDRSIKKRDKAIEVFDRLVRLRERSELLYE